MLKKDIAKILELNIAQRLMVLDAIWESIISETEDIPLSDSQIETLDKRLEAYRNNPQAGSPWQTVKNRILSEH